MSTVRPEQVPGVTLRRLASDLGLGTDLPETPVTGIRLDSRQVQPGEVYVALPGARTHGARFASQVAQAGALAILTDAEGADLAAGVGIPLLVSARLRPDAAELSARIFGRPGEGLQLFGVTGTNGKTTTVALLEAILSAGGCRVGTVGTLGFRLDGQLLETDRSTVTTPDSPDLQGLLARFREAGVDAVALEVSSHAMALSRVDALRFAVGAFLNLGRDHLDFHRDVADYFEAKAALFTTERLDRAVVWVDDEHGREIARRCVAQGLEVHTVGTTEAARYRLRDHTAVAPLGGCARLETPEGVTELRLAMPGWHNMVDAAVAFVMARCVGIPVSDILEGLATAQVPGRMQVLPLPETAPTVVVDFAHTPQAVTATLEALQGFPEVITVLGCGGDRDAVKRPLMGQAAARLSDLLVVTDDNPRTEDPAAIRSQMLSGSQDGRARVVEMPGRRHAIEFALRVAGGGSVVAILGKGHERGQQIGDQVLPFDDAVVAQDAWHQMEGRDR
ncbi:UDP-N-acetylmuramoyl-L-alanyl-D-glutamate--2,6-diaminopimelate ligase [Arachnia propionica]|uniref:UDP-N-acetylmuramoyl-L-alanyl-D-glutamate--2,6-diaminopimelate ligase n=1 Tax=Arachnia propionica TaxID=1750 RepID=A0A3P1T620_9ACTN|nr:UDP-N-acetylmuramoyl-L-alanyl-D-glutamate--2,6-diaminopimelate ligase [Arachnia propionica]RRD04941.1 UDP-N-acetylmuramoyl-L-alanyl-D-glutamate--2,6-diaminopimelate ligase [Arachnia propionica]